MWVCTYVVMNIHVDLQENLLRLQMERSLIMYKKRLVLIWMQRLMREGANDVYVDTVDEG